MATIDIDNRRYSVNMCFLLQRNKEAAESEAIEAEGKTERRESAGKEDAFDANGE